MQVADGIIGNRTYRGEKRVMNSINIKWNRILRCIFHSRNTFPIIIKPIWIICYAYLKTMELVINELGIDRRIFFHNAFILEGLYFLCLWNVEHVFTTFSHHAWSISVHFSIQNTWLSWPIVTWTRNWMFRTLGIALHTWPFLFINVRFAVQ